MSKGENNGGGESVRFDAICDAVSERGVLASLLLHPGLLFAVRGRIHPYHFHSPHCRTIYEAMDRIDSANVELVASELTARKPPFPVIETLSRLTNEFRSSEHLEQFIANVLSAHEMRKIQEHSAEWLATARHNMNPAEFRDRMLSELEPIAQFQRESREKTVKELAAEYEAELKQRLQGDYEKSVRGMRFGIPELDRIVRNGLEPDMLMVIGALYSTGKTSLALSLAYFWATHYGPGIFVSLETKRNRLMARLNRIACPVEIYAQTANRRDEYEMNSLLAKYAARLRDLDLLIIDDRDAFDVDLLCARIKDIARSKPGLKFVVVDYVQKLETQKVRGNMLDRSHYTIRKMDGLRHDIGCAMVWLSQLTGDKIDPFIGPTSENLKANRAIAEASDLTALLFNPPPYDEDYERGIERGTWRGPRKPFNDTHERDVNPPHDIAIVCKVDKQRDGVADNCELRFVKNQQLITTLKGKRDDAEKTDDLPF